MKLTKRLTSLFLSIALVFTLSATALAAVSDTGFSDVDAGAWYAQAVTYCRDGGLMSGVTDTTFAPGATMTRAMLATVLYRVAGQPAVSGNDSFTDTENGAWYRTAHSGHRSAGLSRATAADCLVRMTRDP